jgi:hypothetical protein
MTISTQIIIFFQHEPLDTKDKSYPDMKGNNSQVI